MKLKVFGKLTDTLSTEEVEMSFVNVNTVSDLKAVLLSAYPALQDATYLVVVDGVRASDDTLIAADVKEIALLPPYSGG